MISGTNFIELETDEQYNNYYTDTQSETQSHNQKHRVTETHAHRESEMSSTILVPYWKKLALY